MQSQQSLEPHHMIDIFRRDFGVLFMMVKADFVVKQLGSWRGKIWEMLKRKSLNKPTLGKTKCLNVIRKSEENHAERQIFAFFHSVNWYTCDTPLCKINVLARKHTHVRRKKYKRTAPSLPYNLVICSQL